MKYRVLRNFLKGCSLTTALFIFQACYGTPQGYNPGIDEETYQTDTLQTSASEIESADSAATSDMLEAEEITNSKEESE
ncbi:MAG: hypothetical protein J5604_04715 [Bacteroidales bacterium]|nr:hypothetical protein [Bacteroidales bacterium]